MVEIGYISVDGWLSVFKDLFEEEDNRRLLVELIGLSNVREVLDKTRRFDASSVLSFACSVTLDFTRSDNGFAFSVPEDVFDGEDEQSDNLLTFDEEDELYDTEETLACRDLIRLDGLKLFGARDD